MAKWNSTFWRYTLLGAAGGIAMLICLHLICPSPQPMGSVVGLLSLPVLWIFDAIVELCWHANPDQGLVLGPLIMLALFAYWAAIRIAVAWMIYWWRVPKP